MTVPKSLFNTLQEDKPTEWTEFKIKEHMSTGGKFNSRQIKYILNNSSRLPTTPTTKPIVPNAPTLLTPTEPLLLKALDLATPLFVPYCPP